ncbi:cytoplasmic tRNA 2-thiolation protein 2-A [Cataglyphis hispanica]|uniref:cytoplasmic tRNA 2-thiolation protein 2-A n=1 Tax=Cataglyphis hispanica TaxID=1086592 RepID=UPI00217FD552|nr:cytoplasmic tRNA 2-thiolation protein 2-A [Cataglyphis hispanica]
MCSLNDCIYDSNNEEINENAKDLLMNTTLCRKCRRENSDVLLIGQSGYCKTCFLIITNHKFRATLGKSKIIRHGDSILVDHLGDLNSTVLLHLIKSGMSESVHKKLIFKTIVLYIDDGATMGRTIDERKILQYKIAKEIEDSGFNGYVISLNQVLSKEDTLEVKPIDYQEVYYEHKDHLRTILNNLPDNTSRIDLLHQLRRRLLVSTARTLGCNKVFVTDSAIDIATKVLGDICLGRGAQLSMLANFCDARCDIKILKPLRNFTQQELVYYSQHYEIKSIKLKESNVTATSIQALARNFTTGLESQFSGTVSTIFRTAEKISPRINAQQNIEDSCVLCDARLDTTSSDQISAVRAIEISKLVSSNIDTRTSSNKEKEESNDTILCLDKINCNDNNECNCKKRKITAEDVWRYLCYSCRLIFRNSDILNTLPMPLLSAVQQRLALKSMREEINDFLL